MWLQVRGPQPDSFPWCILGPAAAPPKLWGKVTLTKVRAVRITVSVSPLKACQMFLIESLGEKSIFPLQLFSSYYKLINVLS